MFTGIVNHIGLIDLVETRGDLRIKILCDFPSGGVNIGDSIACNGVCLTVTHKGFSSSGKIYFTADLSSETLSRSAPGQWEQGKKVNLEPSLKLGDGLDGHMVSGHVDGIARIAAIEPMGDSYSVQLEAPGALARFIAEKGSVTLDGVSLTVNRVEGEHFWVNIIPHTWNATTLSERNPGDAINLEVDMLARYVARLLESKHAV